MQKLNYNQYEAIISPEGAEITVTVQVPQGDDAETYPTQIIIRSGGKMLNLSLREYEGISQVIAGAMKQEGWEVKEKGQGDG